MPENSPAEKPAKKQKATPTARQKRRGRVRPSIWMRDGYGGGGGIDREFSEQIWARINAKARR
jgi:hypothetical protein